MLVRQPPEMSDRQELCGVWVAQVELIGLCNHELQVPKQYRPK